MQKPNTLVEELKSSSYCSKIGWDTEDVGEFSLEIAFAQACLFKRVSQIYWLFHSIDKGLLFLFPH